MRRSTSWFALPLFSVFIACSSSPDRDGGAVPSDSGHGNGHPDATTPPPDGGVVEADGGDEDGGEGNDDAEVGMDVVPEVRDPSCPAAAEWIARVEGRIVDGQGQASIGAKAQLCIRTVPGDQLLCLRPVDSGADGQFAVTVPQVAKCMDKATMRFLRVLEDTAASYCHIDISGGAFTAVIPDDLRIYSTMRASVIPPEGNATMVRTVEFADGLEIDIIPDEYFPGSGVYGDLAATPVDLAAGDDCGLAGESTFDGAYALSPEGDINGRAVVRMPNVRQLPANSEVSVYVLGGLGCTLDSPEMIPEGGWTQIENGTVSADGTEVVISPGIPCISWIAYRRI